MTVSLFRKNRTKRAIALLLVLGLLPLHPLFVFAQKGDKQDRKTLESNKKKLQKDLAAMDKELKQTQKDKNLSMHHLFTIGKKIEMREELINTIMNEIYALDAQITETGAQVRTLQQDVEQLKKEYAKMIVYAYRNRDSYQQMMFVFAAQDFNQAYNRVEYIRQVNESRKKKADDIAARQQKLNTQIQNLEQQKAEKQALLGLQESEKSQLAVEKEEKEKTFVGLTAKEKELRAEIDRKKKQAAQIDKAINDLLAAEMARIEKERKEKAERERKEKERKEKERKEREKNKKPGDKNPPADKTPTVDKTPEKEPEKKPNTLDLTPEEQLISDNFAGNRGKLPWPVSEGRIAMGYGRHPHPVLEKVDVNNNGVDISTSRNAGVRALYDGEVTGISEVPGIGKIVIVRHGEYLSMYVRLEEVYVKMGDKVKTKQNIGKVAYNDDDGASIIHLEIWKSGVGKLNPEEWLAKKSS